MKKYTLPLAVVSAVTLQACNQQAPVAGDETAAAVAPPSTEMAALETAEQRLSYGIAYTMGQRMTQDGVPLDAAAFGAGLKDALTGGQPQMTPEEMQSEMLAYQQKAMEEQQAAQAALAEVNIAASEAYLAENAAREGVTVTDSGLQYEIVEAGDGAQPGPDDTVEVHYRGTLVDGTEFDSSYTRGEAITFGVGQVIPGWTEALQLMSTGSKWKLAIPAELAYGEAGAGQVIGPNSALLFEVELLSIPSQDEAAGSAPTEEPAEG
ncbi:MAG: FKBP-type peptidyl-prolyl cis-trans isomerase [Pseudomonadota bacterium]